ncbi:MAG TPA: hypothetical protein VFW02_02920 [Candidatus Limnocylindrales bacterium]|nr:hypothetical protein [Candidatus Limnocylindrales bacterium]
MRRPRGNPDLIYHAQRAGVAARLTRNEGVDPQEAERWIGRWEREAAGVGRARGSECYWDDAWRWIADQRRAPEADKTDMSAVGDDGQVFGG